MISKFLGFLRDVLTPKPPPSPITPLNRLMSNVRDEIVVLGNDRRRLSVCFNDGTMIKVATWFRT